MPRVGFKPKIPVFERAKTVHALDRPAAVIDYCGCIPVEVYWRFGGQYSIFKV
jgi:hypothetical protein